MKFLVITRTRDLFATLPPETQMRLLEGQAAFLDKYVKVGKIKQAYWMDDMKGGVTIGELGSAEEGARLFLENPMSSFQDNEIHVILEWDIAMKIAMESYERLVKK